MENCNPSVVKQLSKELRALIQDPADGISIIFDEANITDVQAQIDGPDETPFSGGLFHIKLKMGDNYPSEPPKGYFITKIFHPNIAPKTGEICVNTLKKDWTADTGIKRLLLIIKCLLIAPNPESALNEEAGRLLLEDYEEYARRARLFTEVHALKPACANAPHPILKDSSSTNESTSSSSQQQQNVQKRNMQAADKSQGAKKSKKALKRL